MMPFTGQMPKTGHLLQPMAIATGQSVIGVSRTYAGAHGMNFKFCAYLGQCLINGIAFPACFFCCLIVFLSLGDGNDFFLPSFGGLWD